MFHGVIQKITLAQFFYTQCTQQNCMYVRTAYSYNHTDACKHTKLMSQTKLDCHQSIYLRHDMEL